MRLCLISHLRFEILRCFRETQPQKGLLNYSFSLPTPPFSTPKPTGTQRLPEKPVLHRMNFDCEKGFASGATLYSYPFIIVDCLNKTGLFVWFWLCVSTWSLCHRLLELSTDAKNLFHIYIQMMIFIPALPILVQNKCLYWDLSVITVHQAMRCIDALTWLHTMGHAQSQMFLWFIVTGPRNCTLVKTCHTMAMAATKLK